MSLFDAVVALGRFEMALVSFVVLSPTAYKEDGQ